MLYSLLVAILGCQCVSGALKSGNTRQAFQTFEREYGKSYGSRQEERMRLRRFRARYEEVMAHNRAQNSRYLKELNKFSDMTEEELNSYLGLGNVTELLANLGAELPVERRAKRWVENNMVEDQEVVDHAAEGLVTPVKNQGHCGSCWAFAAVGAIESAYKQKTGFLKSFSEQELLDCAYETQKPRDGCMYGWYYTAFGYVKYFDRLATYNSYPYTGYDARCDPTKLPPNGLKNSRLTGWRRVHSEDVAEALRERVLAVAIHASTMFSYRSGVFDGCPAAHRSAEVNHAVVVTGYTPEYWTIKNSWGVDWGENGFIRLSRDQSQDTCKLTLYPYYPIIETVDRKEWDTDDVHDVADDVNIAMEGTATQSSTQQRHYARNSIDGDSNGNLTAGSCSLTRTGWFNWWTVTLEQEHYIKRIEIHLRPSDEKTGYLLSDIDGATVHVGNRGDYGDPLCTEVMDPGVDSSLHRNYVVNVACRVPVRGRKVTIDLYSANTLKTLSLCEVKVYAHDTERSNGICPPGTNPCPSDGLCKPPSFC